MTFLNIEESIKAKFKLSTKIMNILERCTDVRFKNELTKYLARIKQSNYKDYALVESFIDAASPFLKSNRYAANIIAELSETYELYKKPIKSLMAINKIADSDARIAAKNASASRISSELDESVKRDKARYKVDKIINKSGLALHESVKSLMRSNAMSNNKLAHVLEKYDEALKNGAYEELIVDDFVNNIKRFDYLLPVSTTLDKIKQKALKNRHVIAITKELEQLLNSPEAYILAVIEAPVVKYVLKPTAVNRNQMTGALVQFGQNKHCSNIIDIAEHNDDVEPELDESIKLRDQLALIKEDVYVCDIYSPVLYLKENEAVFNANGEYFVKTPEKIIELPAEMTDELPADYVRLADICNDENVNIDDNQIIISINNQNITINSDTVNVFGTCVPFETAKTTIELKTSVDGIDDKIADLVTFVVNNFDKIAKVDFAKRIVAKDDTNIGADMFRVNDRIFINTVNENADKTIFYSEVNPIQARAILNEHLGINVASLFEDIMPAQEKYLMQLNETKNEYEASIEKLQALIDKLQAAANDASSDDQKKKLSDAIAKANKKLESVKSDYKLWQSKTAEETTVKANEEDGDDEDNKDTEKDTKKKDDKKSKKGKSFKANDDADIIDDTHDGEPIDDDDVEAAKDDLVKPLRNNDDDVDYDVELEPEDTDDIKAEIDDEDDDEVEDTDDDDTDVDTDEEGFDMVNFDKDAETDDDLTNDDDEADDMPDDAVNAVDMEDDVDDADDNFDTDDTTIDIDDDDLDDVEPNDQLNSSDLQDYNIVSVTFDQNVKTGEVFKTGTVILITKFVDGDGRLTTQSDTYTFYLADDNLPIINAQHMQIALYNEIKNAIMDSDIYDIACKSGSVEVGTTTTEPNEILPADDIDIQSEKIDSEDENQYFDIEDEPDQLTITAKDDDDIDTRSNVFADDDYTEDADYTPDPEETTDDNIDDPVLTYDSEDGETEIELPAPDVDDTEIPEEDSIEARAVVSAAKDDLKRQRKSKIKAISIK